MLFKDGSAENQRDFIQILAPFSILKGTSLKMARTALLDLNSWYVVPIFRHCQRCSHLRKNIPLDAYQNSQYATTYRQLRARRALLQIKDVPLKTRRALFLMWLSTAIAPFWFSMEHALRFNNALLALNWRCTRIDLYLCALAWIVPALQHWKWPPRPVPDLYMLNIA